MYVISIADVIIVTIILGFGARGALKGLVGEFFSLAAVGIGLLCAVLFFRKGAALITEEHLSNTRFLSEIIAFTIIFIIVFIVVKIIEAITKAAIGKIKLGGLDRFLGFFYGAAEGFAVVILLLIIISVLPFEGLKNILAESVIAEKLLELITGYRKEFEDSVEKTVEITDEVSASV